MFGVMRLALTSMVVSRAKRSAESMMAYGMALAAVGIIALAAAGFLLSAGWIALARAHDPLIASASIGAGLLVAALALFFAALQRREREVRENRIAVPAALAASPVAAPLEDVTLKSVLVVAGVGFVLGRLIARR